MANIVQNKTKLDVLQWKLNIVAYKQLVVVFIQNKINILLSWYSHKNIIHFIDKTTFIDSQQCHRDLVKLNYILQVH